MTFHFMGTKVQTNKPLQGIALPPNERPSNSTNPTFMHYAFFIDFLSALNCFHLIPNSHPHTHTQYPIPFPNPSPQSQAQSQSLDNLHNMYNVLCIYVLRKLYPSHFLQSLFGYTRTWVSINMSEVLFFSFKPHPAMIMVFLSYRLLGFVGSQRAFNFGPYFIGVSTIRRAMSGLFSKSIFTPLS